MPVVGYISGRSANEDSYTADAFRNGLVQSGFVPGQDVEIEYRWAEGRYDRLAGFMTDLVNLHVSVIAVAGTPIIREAKAATTTIPIVFVTADDPVEHGLVGSLNRPGGNITGVTMASAELRPKMLQLLKELVSHANLVHMLVNPNNSSMEIQTREAQAAARALGLDLQIVMARAPNEIDAAFQTLAGQKAAALMVASDPFFTSRRNQIVALAARYAVPAIYPWREFVLAGGLISYGSSNADGYRRLGVYVGRVLGGIKPQDLPIQLPTNFELVFNLKTAKSLGLQVPDRMLVAADEVID
jgi:putative ABC transport system substrate-binding protein